MITNVPCPRCGMLVGLDEEVCPHCRTPRDDMELEEGRALARREELRRERRPKLIKAAAAAALLLPVAWMLRGLVTEPLGVAWTEFRTKVEETRQPKYWLKDRRPIDPVILLNGPATAPHPLTTAPISHASLSTPSPAPAPAPPAPAPAAAYAPVRAAAPPASAAAFPADSPAAPATPGSAIAGAGPSSVVETAASPPAPPATIDSMRAWYGVVYDLLTLRPISRARLRFKAKGIEVGSVTTDDSGHYMIPLYKGHGVTWVEIDHVENYRDGLFEDRDPPLRERPLESRRQVLEETTDSDLEPVPMRCKESAETVQLDLVLVPAAKK